MQIGLVEFLLILAIASLTVGPQAALFVDRWVRRANRANALSLIHICAVDDAQHKVQRRQPQHDARRQGDAHPHGGVGDGAHDLGQHDVAPVSYTHLL